MRRADSRLRDTADFAEGVRATAERRDRRTSPGREARRADPAAHELNTALRLGRARGPFRRRHRGAGAAVRRGRLSSSSRTRWRRAEVDALVGAIDPFEARTGADACASVEGGRFFIARADEITFTHPPGDRSSPLLRQFTSSASASPTCAPTSSGRTSASTGTRRSTRSRAPSRRFPGTRTTATPSSSRSST